MVGGEAAGGAGSTSRWLARGTMADIFISYASEDVARVRVLADALEAEGWSVFWDRTIPFGMTWRQVIGREIDEARCVLVAWSAAAIGSTWVHEEADDGARRGILIPVLIEPVMPPIGFRSYQAADLSDWDGTTPTPVFERLIADIARLLEPAPVEVDEARPGTETERKAEEAEAKRRADEEESRKRAEQEAKRKAEEEERNRAEERRKAEAEAVRKKAEDERRQEAEREEARRKAEADAAGKAEETAAEAETAAAEPHKRVRARTWMVATGVAVIVVLGIGGAVLWQPSTNDEERLARQEQMAAEEREARRREQAEAQRRADEEEARRRAEEEAARRAEEEAQRRAEEEEARRRAEEDAARRAEDEAARTGAEVEADRDRVLEAQSLLADLGYDPGPPDGVAGGRTRRAIERHQAAAGLRVDGEVTPSLLASLREAHGATAAKRAEPSVEPSPGRHFKDCDVCPEMVVVPAGSFLMGSPPGEKERDDDEGPQHRVTIAEPFAVGKFEVTNAQFVAFLNAVGNKGTESKPWFETKEEDESSRVIVAGGGRYRVEAGYEIHPVLNVSWYGARAYVEWLSDKTGVKYRLPTEAEWEYAARAGTTTRYWWGDGFDVSRANNDRSGTTAVERYPANAFGLHDVHGNVWEWVADCYEGDAYKTHKNYPAMVGSWHDYCGRVLRGGSWFSDPRSLRSADRSWLVAGIRNSIVGFRVARTL